MHMALNFDPSVAARTGSGYRLDCLGDTLEIVRASGDADQNSCE